MSESTTSDCVISESRYTEVFYNVTNGIHSHDQEHILYFHDNVMFILKTSPGLTVSVLVYTFSF